MADAKISGLADGAPAVATDQLPIARAGSTLRLTLANLQALASVTSAEVGAVSAQAASAVASEVSNRTSADAALAAAVNVVSDAVSVETAARVAAVNTVSNAVSVETAARIVAVNTVSNALSALIVDHNVLSNRVSANSGTGGAGSVTSAEVVLVADAVSAQAASAINVVSAALANEISGRTSAVNAVSNVASNALSVANAASAAANVVSNALSVAEAALSVKINTVSNALSAAEAALSVKINTTSNALSALIVDHNTLSNRVSANSGTGGAGSVTSAEMVTADDVVSAQAASAINVVSVAVAALSPPNVKVLQGDFTVSTTGLADISGLIVTADVVSGLYELNATLFMAYTSAAAAAVGFGLTFPGMMAAGGEIIGVVSVVASNTYTASSHLARSYFAGDGSGSIVLSLVPGANASVLRPQPVFYKGTFLVSTAGTINLQARSSSALTTSAPVVKAGSHVRLVKLNAQV